MTRLILLIPVLFFISCGDKDLSSGDTCSNPVFSRWNLGIFDYDLTEFNFEHAKQHTVEFSDGAKCTMNLKLTGTTCKGEIERYHSVYVGGGIEQPECEAFEGDHTYESIGEILNVCRVGMPEKCSVFTLNGGV